MTIARVWTASARAPGAAASRHDFGQEVLPALRGLQGFAGATVLEGLAGHQVEL